MAARMRIVATADLHGHLPNIPDADLLLIAGDICPDMLSYYQCKWLDKVFRPWLEQYPAVVGIAGNHDFVFEEMLGAADLELPWTYLQDTGTTIQGVKIWGTPWVPLLRNWAFFDEDEDLDKSLDLIPDDTDIVVGHGPPHLYGDLTVPMFGSSHAGYPGINSMLNRVRPKAYVCGHIHEGYGLYRHPDTDVYNVAYVDENYSPGNPPQAISIESE